VEERCKGNVEVYVCGGEEEKCMCLKGRKKKAKKVEIKGQKK